jgi:hypothetical protein
MFDPDTDPDTDPDPDPDPDTDPDTDTDIKNIFDIYSMCMYIHYQ